jgi:hypothetical protein
LSQSEIPPRCRQGDGCLSWSSATLRCIETRAGIASSVQRSLYAVRAALRCSQHWYQVSDVVNFRRSSTRELTVSFRVLSKLTASGLAPLGNSLGVCPPPATSALEARSSRSCLLRHLPASGFLTLLPAYVFQNLPALFHAGAAHGVLPSGRFPLTEPLPPLGSSDLRDVGLRTSQKLKRTLASISPRASPSRLCSL